MRYLFLLKHVRVTRQMLVIKQLLTKPEPAVKTPHFTLYDTRCRWKLK